MCHGSKKANQRTKFTSTERYFKTRNYTLAAVTFHCTFAGIMADFQQVVEATPDNSIDEACAHLSNLVVTHSEDFKADFNYTNFFDKQHLFFAWVKFHLEEWLDITITKRDEKGGSMTTHIYGFIHTIADVARHYTYQPYKICGTFWDLHLTNRTGHLYRSDYFTNKFTGDGGDGNTDCTVHVSAFACEKEPAMTFIQ